MNTYFISDFFVDEVSGGAEINDNIFIQELNKKLSVKKIKSENLNFNIANSDSFFIISNFALIDPNIVKFLANKKRYIIYEHDHKYLYYRNPGIYKDFKAPESEIINKFFYENAVAVFSQSKFHKNIIEKNLNINNVISLSGNLWDDDTLDFMKIMNKKDKANKASIMDSDIPHKNTEGSIRYCEIKNIEYDLIQDKNYKSFLSKISDNNSLIFLPQTPETLSRICVEARMSGMKVITNNMVGATHEEWFSMKGEELIEYMRQKRSEIVNIAIDKIL